MIFVFVVVELVSEVFLKIVLFLHEHLKALNHLCLSFDQIVLHTFESKNHTLSLFSLIT